MLLDFWISLLLTAGIFIAIHWWFGESGLNAFPVLTFLCVTVASFILTSFSHELIVRLF